MFFKISRKMLVKIAQKVARESSTAVDDLLRWGSVNPFDAKEVGKGENKKNGTNFK